MGILSVRIGGSGRCHNHSCLLASGHNILCTPLQRIKGDKISAPWLCPPADSQSFQLTLQYLLHCLKFWPDDVCVLSHMLYHAVDILKETGMAQLVYLIMANGLVL